MKTTKKGLTFCPTPGAPDKSQIWLDFKEFHRRLELMEFFSRDSNDKIDTNIKVSLTSRTLMPMILGLMNKIKKLLIRKSSQNLNLNQTGDPPHKIEHWIYFKDLSNKKS